MKFGSSVTVGNKIYREFLKKFIILKLTISKSKYKYVETPLEIYVQLLIFPTFCRPLKIDEIKGRRLMAEDRQDGMGLPAMMRLVVEEMAERW